MYVVLALMAASRMSLSYIAETDVSLRLRSSIYLFHLELYKGLSMLILIHDRVQQAWFSVYGCKETLHIPPRGYLKSTVAVPGAPR